MASLLTLTQSQPVRRLAAGDYLIEAGEAGGELFVLEAGRLVVLREGVEIAVIDEPGALIGEMSVLLGVDHSASVRAEQPSSVRVIEDAIPFLERSPLIALEVATLACQRLEATSALVVELRRELAAEPAHQGLITRIFSSLAGPPPRSGRALAD